MGVCVHMIENPTTSTMCGYGSGALGRQPGTGAQGWRNRVGIAVSSEDPAAQPSGSKTSHTLSLVAIDSHVPFGMGK